MRRQPDDLDPAAKNLPGLLETVLENKFIVLGVLASVCVVWTALDDNSSKPAIPNRIVSGMELLDTAHHDNRAFTQGLLVHGDHLIESTGMYGESQVRRVDPATGEVLASIDLEPKYFGEGITLFENQIVMLTWREKTGFILDLETLAIKRTFEFSTTKNEGWGICWDRKDSFVVSDGSDQLHFWDTKTLKQTRKVTVKYPDGRHVYALNELEFIPGANVILANVWYKDFIVVIEPESGLVTKVLDFSGLKLQEHGHRGEDCFNGIAYNESSSELYVTGKRWNKMYKLHGVQTIVQGAYRVKQWEGKFGPPPVDWVPPNGPAK
jgi:glutamine cyclotransferase